MRVTDGFLHWAKQTPDKAAIYGMSAVTGQMVCRTYGDLLQTIQPIAADLAQFLDPPALHPSSHPSIPPVLEGRTRVGLLLPNRVEALEWFLAGAMAGAVLFVLDPKWTAHQLKAVLEMAPLHRLVVDRDLQSLLDASGATVPRFVVGDEKAILHPSLAGFTSDQTLRHPIVPLEKPGAENGTPFYVGFTSGTTGIPKGVIRTHQAWITSFAASQIEFGTTATDQIVVPGSLAHSLSLYAALECLHAGATLHLMPQFSPRLVMHHLETYTATLMVGVPTVLGAIAKVALSQARSFPAVRAVVAGGSKLDRTLHTQLPEVFPSAEILEYLGASELGFISLASSREAVPPTSVGRPFQGVSVSIRCREQPGEAKPGEIGWIGVNSAMVSQGYIHASDTAGLRYQDGWATVGDLGWRDEQGYLYVVGREQDMIVSQGMNVYPAAVETVLRQLPEVDEVVVFSLPQDTSPGGRATSHRQEILGAAIRWTGDPLSRLDLQQFCRAHLPIYQCPRHFFNLEHVPLTSSGKINRALVKAQVMQGMGP